MSLFWEQNRILMVLKLHNFKQEQILSLNMTFFCIENQVKKLKSKIFWCSKLEKITVGLNPNFFKV